MSDKHYTHHDDQTHLETALRQAKPWLETNATFLIYGLAAILAAAAGIIWFQRQPPVNSDVSALFQQASEPEDFQAIADEYGNTKLGQLARLNQATGLLNSASGNLFSDREAANAELEEAEAALGRLEDTSGLPAMIHERVLIGQARLAEIRCDGSEESTQAAAAAWQKLLDEYESSIAKELAERQIEALGNPDNAPFYAWFNTLEPKPADDLNMPGLLPGMGGNGPGTSVPEIPENLTLPTLPESVEETPDGDKAAEATTESAETASPSEESATPAEEPASEEPVKSEEPAGSEEPAEVSSEPAETPTEEPVVEEPAESEE